MWSGGSPPLDMCQVRDLTQQPPFLLEIWEDFKEQGLSEKVKPSPDFRKTYELQGKSLREDYLKQHPTIIFNKKKN